MKHSDPSDIASELELRERDAALAKARNYKGIEAVGHCHNCEEPLPAGQLFCPRMEGEIHCCRSDYELRRKLHG